MSTLPEFPAPTGYTSWYPDKRTTASVLPAGTSPLFYSCNTCGSIVADVVKHDARHAAGK